MTAPDHSGGGWTDLGSGCSWKWYSRADGEKGGILFREPCGVFGSVPIGPAAIPDEHVWQLVSEDPLTLSPSILVHPHDYLDENDEPQHCPGIHGHIVDGRWV